VKEDDAMKFNLRRLAKENTNYILLLVFLVFAGLTLSLGKATAKSEPSRMSSTAVTISFGETVSGSISSPAEIDTFTFVGNQGDRILIGITQTSGELWPMLQLHDPNSNLLQTERSPSHAEMTVTLPASGTYSILVSDGFDGTFTGGYNLFLQRLNNPVNANSITFGEISSGSISKAAEMDPFTFSASAEDIILIGISKTSGDVWPEIRLYDSNGNLLQTERSPSHSEMTVTLSAMKYIFLPIIIKPPLNSDSHIDFELENRGSTKQTVGKYTILVSDGFNGIFTGGYNLFLQRLNNPSGALPISFNQIKSGTISLVAEMDLFTFAANENDIVILGISEISGDVWPEIRLYDPHINLLQTERSPSHAEMTVTLPASGTYTILVSDGFNGTFTGGYNLFLQRLNNPSGAVPISFGQTKPGTISLAAEMDIFTFAANENDTVIIGISETSGDVWPEIRLYDPHINLLQTERSPSHAEMTVTLPASGTYSILVSDGFNGTFTGGYNLFLQRLNNPSGAVSISFGQAKPGTISLAPEMDIFTFEANENDTVIIGISKTSGDIWPEIRLYDPNVNLLRTESHPSYAEMTVTLPASGTYSILVSDGFNGTFTGGYEISLQKTVQ
jgi:hypothetical protein